MRNIFENRGGRRNYIGSSNTSSQNQPNTAFYEDTDEIIASLVGRQVDDDNSNNARDDDLVQEGAAVNTSNQRA